MSARLLIDQCVSRRLAATAFDPIADLVYVGDIASGATDDGVLALARRLGRILVTEDFDFGRMIFGDGIEPPLGVIHLVLARMTKNERQTKLAAEAAALIAAAPGHFVVFSKGVIRARPLPLALP